MALPFRYNSGAMGYTETREVQDNFVSIRARPSSSASGAAGFASQVSGGIRQPQQTIVQAAPTVVRQETVTTSGGDGDLVARIISQLTPFIQVWCSSIGTAFNLKRFNS